IATGQQKIAQLSQQQVALQSEMLDVQRRQLAVQEQTLVVTQLQLEQTQLQTLMQQVALLQRQRQRELKEAAFSIRRRMDQLKDDRDPLRGYVLVTLELRDAEAAGLIPSELEEIADKEYAEGSLKALRDAKDASAGKLTERELGLVESVGAYATALVEVQALRDQLQKQATADRKEEEAENARRRSSSSNTGPLPTILVIIGTLLVVVGVGGLVAGKYVFDSVIFLTLGSMCGVPWLAQRQRAQKQNALASAYGSTAWQPSPIVRSLGERITAKEHSLAELKPQRDAALTRVPELARW
ncbi:MAG: hypothetical protein FJ096_19845, partial [Deltaproteobacteria bacterium]|nr:hypothetical protein [Deltaproteobacteria bacterium]